MRAQVNNPWAFLLKEASPISLNEQRQIGQTSKVLKCGYFIG
jgi:hypothetical protein